MKSFLLPALLSLGVFVPDVPPPLSADTQEVPMNRAERRAREALIRRLSRWI